MKTVRTVERRVPLLADVDVLVVGGTCAGVSAALASAKAGRSVFLVNGAAYLGDDVCGPMRLWLEPGETPRSELARALFAQTPVAPAHVKWTLENALVQANVGFMLGCLPTDVLRGEGGGLAGVVVANRSGSQAVRAKVVIDATRRAQVARLAGGRFTPYPPGIHRFERIVIGGEPGAAACAKPELIGQVEYAGKTYKAYRYTLEIEMPDDSPRSFMRAERIARDATWQEGQAVTSEWTWEIPPDAVRCMARIEGEWPGAGAVDLDAFRPEGHDRLIVAGAMAGLSPRAQRMMSRVTEGIECGARLGELAARLAATYAASPACAREETSAERVPGDVREAPRAPGMAARMGKDCAVVAAGGLPVLAEADVVVAGGGTSGAPAGIAAARAGSSALVIEATHGLGGLGTLGMISRHWYGNVCGFAEEVDCSVGRFAYHNFLDWEIEPKMEWLRRELHKAGGEAWYQSIVYGAIVEGRRVTGVAVATPLGNGAVLAREVVDATGNADVAIAAGAPYHGLAEEHFTVQGTGLSDRNPDTSYNNSDWCVADDADPVDCTRMLAAGHKKYRTVFDTSPLIGTRERRRIVGEYTLQPMDIILHRRFRDSICHARSNFDAHSYYIHPLFRYWFSSVHDVFWCYVPYRCLLPCDVEHVIVTGLALSVHRDGLPVVRMQPDMQNQGYAAGLAAALCAQGGIAPRELPVRELQQRLVEVGCLDAGVLDHEDTPPPTAEQARHAAMRLDKPADIALLFAAPPETARTALKAIFPRCTNVWQRLLTAEMLACFGDASGFAELREHLASDKEDEGQQFPRMSRTGHVSGYGGTDAVVVSIADTGHPDAAAAIGSFISRLNPGTNYSHFWAAAWACGELADARLAAPLAACLRMPGMSGHQITTQQEMNDRTSDVASPGSKVDNLHYEQAARELILASALYRCGDKDGVGRDALMAYTRDLRGAFAAYAARALAH